MSVPRRIPLPFRIGLLLAFLVAGTTHPLAAQEDDEDAAAEEAAAQEDDEDAEPEAEEAEQEDLEAVNAPPPAVPPESVPPGTDSVTAIPGETYGANGIHRFLFGDLNRELWTIPITVEVLDLATEAGGLEPSELSGGSQTLGLHFDGSDGLPYQFRSIVKDATRAIPPWLRVSPVSDAAQDQMAAQFPLSAMVIAELLEASDVLVAKPRPVVMPDDPRLGEYRELFAGRMGWIEERPDEREGDRPGFRGSSKVTGTEEMYERLDEDPRHYVNVEAFLEARLIDMLVGDWDRHQDQWRWASFEESDGRVRWDPIPRDRDWAFSRIDGLFPAWAGLYNPQYHGFGREYPPVFNLHWNAQFLDRRLLSEVPAETYERLAEEVRRTLSDEVLRAAISVLPPGYREAVGDGLLANLQHRRDELPRLSRDYYELLARWVDIHAANFDDVATVSAGEDGTVEVEIQVPERNDLVYYHRVFSPAETDEIRLYVHGGDDRIRIVGEPSPIKLRLMGGEGDDHYVDETTGHNVLVYDDDGENEYDLGPDGWLDETHWDTPDEVPDIDFVWETRDWGSNWVPAPYASYDPDIGPYVGASLTRYGFGFRRNPWRSNLTVTAAVGPALGRTLGQVSWTRTLTAGGLRAGFDVEWRTAANERFFGFGNEVEDFGSEFHRSERSDLELGLRLESAQDQALSAFAGPVLRIAGAVEPEPGTIFETARPYGAGDFQQLGAQGGIAIEKIDQPEFPRTGGAVVLTGRVFPAMLDVTEVFGSLRAVGRGFWAASEGAPFEPALHVRVGAEKVWGDAPFHELAALGGAETLPGYRSRRFLGNEAVSGGALVRLKLVHLRWLASTDVGVHGIASTGRVWLEGEESDAWHAGYGGGLWFRPGSIDTALSLSLVKGEDRNRFYLKLGFPL